MVQRSLIKYNILGIAIITLGLVCGAKEASATSSVSIATPSRIDVELAPTSNGAISYQTGDVVITTTDTTGFKVMLSTASNTTALTSKVASQNAVIPSITTATKLSNLPVNTWGVYFGASTPTIDSTFSPITTNNKQYITNTNANASGTYKLAIGAKADTSLKAGNYSNNLVISVIAEAPVITSLANATYMQDVTPEICSNSKVWASDTDSVSLIDSRDGKSYKVARLKDGNCWMQENLKLTLSTSKPLTPDDSDVSKNWTPEIGTRTAPGNPNTNHMSSWNFGDGQRWYYQWNAATAGSGKDISSGNAADSICPKGWKLPLGGSSNNSINGSFYYLLNKYNATSSSSQSITLALAPPLSFVREGYAALNGVNNNITDFAAYWSRTVASTGAWAFYFQGNFYPSYDYSRSMGLSVRCMVLTGEI